MNEHADLGTPSQSRLNLFAFRSETDVLFILFMTAAFLLTVHMGFVFIAIFAPQLAPQPDLESMIRGEALLETEIAYVPRTLVSAGLIFAVFVGSLLQYRRHPNRVRRRRQLQPLAERDVQVQEAVDQLAAQVNLRKSPTVEMPMGRQGSNGQAFGRKGNYILALDGGHRVLHRMKSKYVWFRAVVFHEFAHIANNDVWRSYFAEAVWVVMMFVTFAPFLLWLCTIFSHGQLSAVTNSEPINQTKFFISAFLVILSPLTGIAITVAMAFLIRASLLQTREYQADWQAASWGAAEGLKALLLDSVNRHRAPRRLNLLRLHPPMDQRISTLAQPNRLFQFSHGISFFVGFLIAPILVGELQLLLPLFTAISEPIRITSKQLHTALSVAPDLATAVTYWGLRAVWFALFLTLVVAFIAPLIYLMVGVLGTQVQKQSVVDLAEGRTGTLPYFRLGIPTILFVAGMELGTQAVPLNPYALQIDIFTLRNLILPLVTAVAAWAYLAYARFLSTRILATHTGPSHPVWRMRLTSLALGGWLIILFMPGFMLTLIATRGDLEAEISLLFFPALLIWLALAAPLGILALVFSWIGAKALNRLFPPRCTQCSQLADNAHPAVESCASCGHKLGEWLYVPN